MNFKTLNKKSIAALTLFLILGAMLSTSTASATSLGNISIVQAGTTNVTEWTLPASAVGTTFAVSLYISEASPIWGWIVEGVTWDSAVVNCVAVGEGPYMRGNELYYQGSGIYERPTLYVAGTIDNTEGVLNGGIGCTFQNPIQYDGDQGVLCNLVFQVVGTGNANIHLVAPQMIGEQGEEPTSVDVVDPEVIVGNPFVVPEYALGGLAALGAAFVAFFAFAAKKKISIPTFSRHI